MADIVAVENVGVLAERRQLLLEQVGDRRLAGTRQAGEPQDRRLLMLLRGARCLVDIERLPMDVGGAAQRMQ